MDTNDQGLSGEFEPRRAELQVSLSMREYLFQAAKWARFLAIIGFVFLGIMVVGALFFTSFMGSNLSGIPGISNQMPGGVGIFVIIYFLFFAILYYFPTLYLFQFASKTKSALLAGEEVDLAFAFSRLKSFFKFWGILLIIIFSFYLLLIVGFLVGSALWHS